MLPPGRFHTAKTHSRHTDAETERLPLSDFTAEEIDAIGEHEHLPETIATELGCYFVHCPDRRRAIASL